MSTGRWCKVDRGPEGVTRAGDILCSSETAADAIIAAIKAGKSLKVESIEHPLAGYSSYWVVCEEKENEFGRVCP